MLFFRQIFLDSEIMNHFLKQPQHVLKLSHQGFPHKNTRLRSFLCFFATLIEQQISYVDGTRKNEFNWFFFALSLSLPSRGQHGFEAHLFSGKLVYFGICVFVIAFL